jgi:aryl-alcohol dehydrogenase-like predicted oxidoreductase
LQLKPNGRNALKVESRVLGSTKLIVSQLGLGMAALGRPGYINLHHAEDLGEESSESAMEHHTHSVLDAAWNAGIRYFDVARSYGLGEKFLGNWLRARSISRAAVTVGSKWGYTYAADWKIEAETHEIKNHTLTNLRKQWLESVSWLNGYIGVYQIHSATRESGVLDDPNVLRELARLKSSGTHIGLSLSGPDQAATLRKAMAITVDGLPLFETVQVTWNLLEQSAGPALSEAHAEGMGVIVKEALANGRLTHRNTGPDFASKRAILQREAARLDSSMDAIALAACLVQPFVDVVLSDYRGPGAFQPEKLSVEPRWGDDGPAESAGRTKRFLLGNPKEPGVELRSRWGNIRRSNRERMIPGFLINRATSVRPNRATASGLKSRNASRKASRLRRTVIHE